MRPMTPKERRESDYWAEVMRLELIEATRPGTTTRFPRLTIVWE